MGLMSRSLIAFVSEHQNAIGPMACTITDPAHIHSIIAGRINTTATLKRGCLIRYPVTLRLFTFATLEEHKLAYPATELPLTTPVCQSWILSRQSPR